MMAQQAPDAFALGSTQSLLNQLQQNAGTNARRATASSTTLEVQVSPRKKLSLQINVQQQESADQLTLIGSVVKQPNSSFYIRIDGQRLLGNIILTASGEGYRYFADEQGSAYVEPENIDLLICTYYPKGAQRASAAAPSGEAAVISEAANDLQSLPSASRCMMLDFDGQYVVNTPWEDGRAINAAPSGMSDADIQAFWELVSEDFRPFNVNITTSEAVFNRYPRNQRMRCIITPTNFTGGAGGVAFGGSFSWNDDTPCWVFMPSPKAGGEAASHELGHTVGLAHDGRTSPQENYFAGHGDWAPIMGVGYYRPITQWSRGEYSNANNRQDDLSIIAGYLNYRGDDHGNNFAGSTTININANNQITRQQGVIERTGDLDFFRFNCGTGNVALDINTVGRYGDLDILVRLYEASTGNQIGVFNGNGLNTRLEAYLDAGQYYLAIDGTGAGNAATNGYSDYASLGSFFITGTIPAGTSTGVVTLYQDCNYGGYAVSLPEGEYTVNDLRARGITNDDVSSLRIQSGYQVTLYADNPFGGRSLVKNSDDECLVNDTFNDLVSSVRVSRASNSTTRIEAENYSAMNGVQTEACSEGGQNVGYIEAGDWMAYENITVPASGTYVVQYRVASATGGGRLSLDIDAGATVLGERAIPSTGGWQSWVTVSHTVTLNAGTYNFGIYAQQGGWNINWWSIQPASQARAADQSGKPLAENVVPEASSLSVYPNPAQRTIHVGGGVIPPHTEISITDLSGRTVRKKQPLAAATIDVANLPKGVYILAVTRDGYHTQHRFVKE